MREIIGATSNSQGVVIERDMPDQGLVGIRCTQPCGY
jgi:hypothetical protein